MALNYQNRGTAADWAGNETTINCLTPLNPFNPIVTIGPVTTINFDGFDKGICYQCGELKSKTSFKKDSYRKHLNTGRGMICSTCRSRNNNPKRLLECARRKADAQVERHGNVGKRTKKRIGMFERRIALQYLNGSRGRTVRHGRLKLATPSWVKREWYIPVVNACRSLQRDTQVKHHLDHIIPLAGKTVSGLHVPWNLVPIPAEDNCAKGNRLEPGVLICGFPNGDGHLAYT
jgi:hypothetical protein